MSNGAMLETAILLAQTVATGSIAAWMFTGARDNILYPSQTKATRRRSWKCGAFVRLIRRRSNRLPIAR